MSIEEKLSRLRPGMSVDDLIAIVGDAWREPDPKWGNSYSWDVGHFPAFSARIDRERRLGRVAFYRDFPQDFVIAGLHSQMAIDDVRRCYPDLEEYESEDFAGRQNIRLFRCTDGDGDDIEMRVMDGRVIGFDLLRRHAVYPEPPGPKLYPKDGGLKAYEIDIPNRLAERGRGDDHGWCFGLPPGITPEQWPLDKRTGHPMRHAFTLLLPEGYRRKGSDRVAISVFDGDWNGSSIRESVAVSEVWDKRDAPENVELMPVWQHRTGRHAHEYRIDDQLGEPYAVIWLTRAEFDGPLCRPRLHPDNKTLRGHLLPKWTRVGSANAYAEMSPGTFVTERERHMQRTLGIAPPPPPEDLAYHRALQWSERAFDPNAGVTPPEGWNDEEVTAWGYHRPYRFGESSPDDTPEDAEAKFGRLPWAKDLSDRNIGGTMQPVQAYPSPAFSPYYVGIDEAMGGFNFGGGTAQLDLEEMRLDWACG